MHGEADSLFDSESSADDLGDREPSFHSSAVGTPPRGAKPTHKRWNEIQKWLDEHPLGYPPAQAEHWISITVPEWLTPWKGGITSEYKNRVQDLYPGSSVNYHEPKGRAQPGRGKELTMRCKKKDADKLRRETLQVMWNHAFNNRENYGLEPQAPLPAGVRGDGGGPARWSDARRQKEEE